VGIRPDVKGLITYKKQMKERSGYEFQGTSGGWYSVTPILGGKSRRETLLKKS